MLENTIDFKVKKKEKGKTKFYVILGFVLVVVLVLTIPSFNMIDETEIAVVRRLGTIREQVGSGIHWRFWPIHRIDRYSITAQEQIFEFNGYSIDAQNVRGEVTVIYYLNPGSVNEIARQFGRQSDLASMLDGVLLQEIQNVFATKTAMEIVESRAYLSGLITTGLREVGEYFHINIRQTNVENLYFSSAFEGAVEQRMIAEQEMMQAEFERDRAVVLAEQERQVAEIEAEANRLRAQGEADALNIILDEWSYASPEVIDARLRQQFIYAWNGILPEVFAGEDISLIFGGNSNQPRSDGPSE
ncbi:MAG: SPFH domain-containing protein [Lachnospiraceae bacterium]|nr:SPFH domain-containing protein [Lachnospiraceae bacterium]